MAGLGRIDGIGLADQQNKSETTIET